MTAPRRLKAETAPHIHPPKIELFDLQAMTNTDPKGIVRAVREYRVEPFGLYLARDVIDHHSIRALESWLLPELGLRITDWIYSPGHEWEDHFYIDVVSIDVDADWISSCVPAGEWTWSTPMSYSTQSSPVCSIRLPRKRR
jgi:hypothetical protein